MKVFVPFLFTLELTRSIFWHSKIDFN